MKLFNNTTQKVINNSVYGVYTEDRAMIDVAHSVSISNKEITTVVIQSLATSHCHQFQVIPCYNSNLKKIVNSIPGLDAYDFSYDIIPNTHKYIIWKEVINQLSDLDLKSKLELGIQLNARDI